MRYKGIPPRVGLIEKVVKKSGLKFFARFENVWGMPAGTLKLVRYGLRELPAKFWHIFYDFDIANQMYGKSDKKIKPLPNNGTILDTNKTLIDGLRNR